MSELVGTWLYDTSSSLGDTVNVLGLDTRNNAGVGFGTAVALGWTPTLRIWRAGDNTRIATLTGAWETNAADPESRALYAIGDETANYSWVAGTTTLVPATAMATNEYECMQVMVGPGGTHIAVLGPDELTIETFRFRVGRIP